MVTATQAIAKAKTISSWTIGMCDQFVAQMYGFNSSGYNTAVDNWTATPANLKHVGDTQAPAGALMYWGGGDGHVALSLGNGNIVSTDIGGMGTVTTAPASDITRKWNKPYLGWAYPYFQGKEATNSLGGITGTTTVGSVTPAGDILNVSPASLAGSFVGGFFKPFTELLTFGLWGFETMTGIVLMALGFWVIARREVS